MHRCVSIWRCECPTATIQGCCLTLHYPCSLLGAPAYITAPRTTAPDPRTQMCTRLSIDACHIGEAAWRTHNATARHTRKAKAEKTHRDRMADTQSNRTAHTRQPPGTHTEHGTRTHMRSHCTHTKHVRIEMTLPFLEMLPAERALLASCCTASAGQFRAPSASVLRASLFTTWQTI